MKEQERNNEKYDAILFMLLNRGHNVNMTRARHLPISMQMANHELTNVFYYCCYTFQFN